MFFVECKCGGGPLGWNEDLNNSVVESLFSSLLVHPLLKTPLFRYLNPSVSSHSCHFAFYGVSTFPNPVYFPRFSLSLFLVFEMENPTSISNQHVASPWRPKHRDASFSLPVCWRAKFSLFREKNLSNARNKKWWILFHHRVLFASSRLSCVSPLWRRKVICYWL